jgi:NADH:ubiquinone oxidoreductase subunit D
MSMFNPSPGGSAEDVAKKVEEVTQLALRVNEGKKACESFHQQLLENAKVMLRKTDEGMVAEAFAAEMYHAGFKIGYEVRRFVEVEEFVGGVGKEYLK